VERRARFLFFLVAGWPLVACSGGGGGPAPVTVVFQVTQVSPAPTTSGVPLQQEIRVIFSKLVDPTTVHIQSFNVVAESGDAIPGIRSVLPFTQNVVRFTPEGALLPFATHSIRVNTQIRDQDGNPLDRDYHFQFLTEEAGPVLPTQAQVVDHGGLMRTGRFFHRMTLLDNARFLVTGGYTVDGQPAVPTAENLIPAIPQSSTIPGGMQSPRAGHVQIKLRDGRVLVAGGEASANPFIPLAGCEIFDPAPGVFRFDAVASMNLARSFAHATLLADGRVLVSGGQGVDMSGVVFRDDAEIYDPATDTWTLVSSVMETGRSAHFSATTADGDVVVVGGTTGGIPGATRFDAASGTFVADIGTPLAEHFFAAATVQPGGRPFLAGGVGTTEVTMWDPGFGFFGAINRLPDERAFATATPFSGGRVLVIGGIDLNAFPPLVHATLDVFFPVGSTGKILRVPDVTLPEPTSHHAAALGPDGAVWITGGVGSDGTGAALRQVTAILPEEP